jgi:transcriptional regulator with GAF, ATPase, and Fis domain
MDEGLLTDTFVELADTMVADFDVIDFLHLLSERSAQLLGASAAGVVLSDPRGELRLVAASTEAAQVLELFQLQDDQGPCLDCFRTGRPVSVSDLAAARQTWPQFAAAASEAGFGAVHALPMRLRTQVVGSLNLFRDAPGDFSPEDMRVGQALADVATIGLLQERNTRRSAIFNEQLQSTLNRRVVIEQATGKVAERLNLNMDQAFTVLRSYVGERNLRLSDLADRFIQGAAADFLDLIAAASEHQAGGTDRR